MHIYMVYGIFGYAAANPNYDPNLHCLSLHNIFSIEFIILKTLHCLGLEGCALLPDIASEDVDNLTARCKFPAVAVNV